MTKEQISKEIKECEERLAKLREEMNKPEYGGKRWKPKRGEKYYFICESGDLRYTWYKGDYIDKKMFLIGNRFKTKEEAEFAVERLKVIAELSDFAEGNEAVWDGDTGHWQIFYTFFAPLQHLTCEECYTRKSEGLYFPSKEAAEAAVEAVGRERVKKYYLGVK